MDQPKPRQVMSPSATDGSLGGTGEIIASPTGSPKTSPRAATGASTSPAPLEVKDPDPQLTPGASRRATTRADFAAAAAAAQLVLLDVIRSCFMSRPKLHNSLVDKLSDPDSEFTDQMLGELGPDQMRSVFE